MKASADPTRHRRLAVAGFALFFAAHYLAWISVSNAQNAAGPKAELKSKDAKDAKAAKPEEKPKPNIPRDQVIARPGGEREVVPSFKISKKLPYVDPTPAAAKEFDEMRKDGKKLNGKALDAYAKAMVYMMTDPAKRAEISTHVEKILGPIRQAEGVGAANLNTQFLQAYKKLLIKYVRDLMDNHIAVKINGLLLLNDLYSGKADVEDGVPVVVDVLADKKQDDAVHYVAMKTLDNIKRIYPTAIKVENESKGADAVLAIATNPNVQGVLLEKAVESLGVLGRAFKGDLPDRAEIATFLANVALNEKLPLRTRVTAALSLGQLKVPQEIGWNFELQCFVVGKVLRELIDAANGGNVNPELFRFWVLVFREAVRNMEAQARNASPEMKQFADVFKPVIEALAPQNPMQPNLADLDQWLAAHQQPAKRKMAERGNDIVRNNP